MHQRDFILRIIEQLGAALAVIRSRILRQEKTADVRTALADAAGQAGLDIEVLRGFDLQTLRLFAMPMEISSKWRQLALPPKRRR